MLIALCGGVGLFCSCSQDDGGPQEADGAIALVPLFTQSSFDGCWNWYEEGKHAYSVTVMDGEVVSFQPLSRRSARNKDSAANCAIDTHDGLIVISSADRGTHDRWTTVTTLRFDLSDTPGRSCRDGLRRGVIAGRRTVEHNDPNDHFLFPPQSSHQGLLVRCNSR